MRTITNAELKASTLKAMSEGTLLALCAPEGTGCFYELEIDGHTYNCAVGSALTPEEKAQAKLQDVNGHSAWGISGLIVNFEDVEFASELQHLHDQITSAEGERRTYRLAQFKAFLEAA